MESTLVEMSSNVESVPSGLAMRTLPASSVTKSLPSGANSMSVGFVRPLATGESVKPDGRFAASRAGPMGKTNKVPTEVSNASARNVAVTNHLLRALCLLGEPPLQQQQPAAR